MDQFGLLELSESQGVFEEDEQDGAPANKTNSQKPASQCMFTFSCKLLICCPLVFIEFFKLVSGHFFCQVDWRVQKEHHPSKMEILQGKNLFQKHWKLWKLSTRSLCNAECHFKTIFCRYCTVTIIIVSPVFTLTSNFLDDIVGQRSVRAALRSLRMGKAGSSVFRLYCTLSYLTVKKMKKMCLFPLRMTCLKRREMVCRPKLVHLLSVIV